MIPLTKYLVFSLECKTYRQYYYKKTCIAYECKSLFVSPDESFLMAAVFTIIAITKQKLETNLRYLFYYVLVIEANSARNTFVSEQYKYNFEFRKLPQKAIEPISKV